MQNKEQELNCEVLPDDFSSYDLSFKVIVIGDAGIKIIIV